MPSAQLGQSSGLERSVLFILWTSSGPVIPMVMRPVQIFLQEFQSRRTAEMIGEP